jgi:hypothetical protein
VVDAPILALSPDGELAAVAHRDRVFIQDLGRDGPGAEVELPGLRAIAASDGEIWAVAGLESLSLHRVDRRGVPAADALDLGELGGPIGFDRVTVSPAGAVLLGETPVSMVMDCGELRVEVFRPAPEFASAIGENVWLFVDERRIGIDRGGGIEMFGAVPPLPRGSEVTGACSLLGGRAIAVHLAGAEPSVWLIDAHTGQVRRRLPLPGCTRAALAEARGQVLVLAGDRLRILDLRYGQAVLESRSESPLLDIAVCRRGERVAAVRLESGRPEIVWADYGELFGAGDRLDWRRAAEPPSPAEAAADTGAEKAEATLWPGPPSPAEGATLELPELPEPPPPPALPAELRGLELGAAGRTAIAAGDAALRRLEQVLALVAAWTQRAICEGWDSGRLAHGGSAELPFEREVRGLLGGSGEAGERLVSAQALEREIALEHDRRLGEELVGDNRVAISPLAALAREFALEPTEVDVLLVIAAPAIWGEMARLYAICANDRDRPMCDEWLVSQILGRDRGGRRAVSAALDPTARLLAGGLVLVGGGPRPFAALTPHPLLIRRLFGDRFDEDPGDDWVSPRDAETPYESLILRGALAPALRSLARRGRGPARLVVRGATGSGRRSLLAALAHAAGRRLGIIEIDRLARRSGSLGAELAEALRRARLRGWLPCVDGGQSGSERGPEVEHVIAEEIAGFAGAITFRVGPGQTPALAPGYTAIDLEPLSEGERLAAWRRALADRGLDTAPAAGLASGYRFGPGVINQVVARAVEADLEPDPVALSRALHDGVRQHRGSRMGELAVRVERLATWSQVCLPPEVLDCVRELVSRVRHRMTVFERWGFGRVLSTSRGLTALFEGRPGTGKTMVAGLVASELGCDLYRIDLSRVLSKWVGETERHLAEVFDAAEGGRIILLFDEADSLFGKRTEVRSANDRFANIEVNYLLQRLDSFEGIAILTTNFAKSIDPAFRRRLSVRLSFPFPDDELRARIWRAHIPADVPVEADLGIDELARKYPLSGGYIRNIALRAAFLAAHESRPLAANHLERAVALEYRAMGKLTAGGALE